MNEIYTSRYRAVEHLQEALAHVWDVEISQTGAGPIETFLTARRVDGCLVYESGSNQSLLCSGSRGDDFWTISPITRGAARGRFRGRQLDEGQILVLDPGGEVYQQVAAGQRQHAISIPVDLAERISQAEYGISAAELWGGWCLKSSARIADRMTGVIEALLYRPGSLRHSRSRAGIDLAGNMIALAQEARQLRHARSSLAHRRRVVGQAENLIRSRLNNPPSVTELCEATCASRRLLFYAFRELLGRTPSAHAKTLRLHAARRRILARRNERCVQQVATELGFRHLGQFAIDYARLFGESPSKTR